MALEPQALADAAYAADAGQAGQAAQDHPAAAEEAQMTLEELLVKHGVQITEEVVSDISRARREILIAERTRIQRVLDDMRNTYEDRYQVNKIRAEKAENKIWAERLWVIHMARKITLSLVGFRIKMY